MLAALAALSLGVSLILEAAVRGQAALGRWFGVAGLAFLALAVLVPYRPHPPSSRRCVVSETPVATAATHHHMPAAISLNLFRLRRDLRAVGGFNAKVALLLTRVVGTMWAFWAFNGIALVSLPSAIHQHSLTVLINWVSSNWIQLILLPALMVGQNLAAAASDARAVKTFEDAEAAKAALTVALDRLDVTTEGGLAAVLAEAKAARSAAESAFVAAQALAAVAVAKPQIGGSGGGGA